MLPAQSSPDEARRLEALRQYAVLDTLPEQSLDDLTALAAHICEAPIALISLIDEHRQWFKSKVGLEVAETSRDISFCAHALLQADLFIVPDATQDERFAQNPLVMAEPGIRFYAGAPLVTPEGAVLGTLCVIDRVARTLTATQEQAMGVLARQVMAQLELRRQTRELAKSERLLRTIFDSEPECVKVLGPDGSLLMINRAGLAMIEAESFGQVVGRCVYPLVAPEHRAKFEGLIASVFRGDSGTMEFQIVGLKGATRWMETHAAPLRDERGEVTALLGITRDITAHKRADDLLRVSHERFQIVARATNDAVWDWNLRTNTMSWNEGYRTLFGYRPEETNSTLDSWTGRIHPEDVDRVVRGIHEVIDCGGHSWSDEYRFRRRDGTYAEIFDRGSIIRDAQGSSARMIGAMQDITERKQAEEARSASEARYRTLFEYAPDGIVIADPESYYIDANTSICRMLGYTRDELIGLHASDIVAKAEVQHIGPALSTINSRSDYHREWQFRRKDGSIFGAEVIATKMPDGNLLGMIRDITERKTLEQQFLRAQRVESIGTLAGGIAHDLNNVLGPIILSLELLEMKFSDPDSRELIAILSSSARRGADMVKQVLSFARGVEGERTEVQVRHVIHDIEKIANETFLKHIHVRTIIPRDLWTVSGDPTQLHQVLLNLCVNARDAMPEGGTITLSAENIELDAHYAGLNPEAHCGSYVVLQMEDSGTGIAPEILEKIFDPFFTTKEVGKGTGLGLSTSLAIVKSHGGFFRVHSELGKGTTFKVYLPAQSETSPESAAEIAAEMPRGNGELILVVDDEPAVRQITQQTLEAFGYRVLLAADGAEAAAVYATRRAEIAAVFTDMMMPVMDGLATIQVLRKMNPAVRIIGASGLSAYGNFARAASLGVKHFLPKPYSAETLLKVLKQILVEAA